MKFPTKLSSSACISKPRDLPVPRQLFSLTLNAIVPPDVPTPAPALISPVGFSSTIISITFKSFEEPLLILDSTDLKIFLDFMLEIDFSKPKFVNGSP